MSKSFTCPTIDFVFLQDLSGSFADDLPILKSQIANVIATVEDIDQNADFAVASFIDKPNGVFGTAREYVYQTNLALSSDNAAVIASVNALSTQSGLDIKEAQLEALMQVALRPGEIGFRADTKRIVMLSTDSAFHQAGDFAGAPANNGDAILDGNGVGEDYPSIAQAAAALVATGIFPVFSVTADQKALYQTLVNDLGTGAVVVLSANSSDFADAVRVAIAKACGHVTQEGTEAEDDMEGTELEDGMFGLGGDDRMHGRAGDDLVDGGSGNDTIKGGKGADELRGGTGADDLDGGKARDTLTGGLGNDTLTGGTGRDTFVINPGGGGDTITDFENGIDVIDLSAFHRFEGVAAVMNAIQNGTSVVLNLPGGTSVTLQGFTLAELGLEDVILEPFGDAPVAANDIATATANKQTLIDVLANDTDVDGDTLSIVSVGSSANATIRIKGGMISYKADASFSGADSFTYTITDGNFTHTATVNVTVLPNLIGDNLANVLVGTQFDDLIKGKGGDDTIAGNDGNDTILGGDGADVINGGLGLDLIRGGNGNDIITAGPTGGLDFPDKDTVYGGDGNDQITAGWGDDILNGGKGRDTIHGEQGDDRIFGNGGNDNLNGGIENDEIWGGAGNDTIIGGTGNDQLRGGLGQDNISGGDGRDEIYGSGGVKAGVSDNDTLSGGLGADTFIFQLALDQNLNGDDIITDYDITEDRIQLDGDVLVQLTDTVAGVLIEQVTGGSILVQDILAADIRATISGLNEVL
jgi:Ca2+-binding RTX toxin-like protein